MNCPKCNGEWAKLEKQPVKRQYFNGSVRLSTLNHYEICPECLGNYEPTVPDVQRTGNQWHRQLVLPDDFEISEEFVDRKLFCGRCLGRKVVCDSCAGIGYITIGGPYGSGYDIGCGQCNKSGMSPPEKDETQEIKVCD